MVRVRLDQPPIRRVIARVAEVPGFGWRAFAPTPLTHPVVVGPNGDPPSGPISVANGLVTVEVDAESGTFSIDGLAGFGRLVDGGDLGDSYNYSPPRSDSVVDTPESVTVSVIERGPVRARVAIDARYCWPDKVDGSSQRRVGAHTVDVRSTIELRADDAVVRIETTFVNPAHDHRLRVHLPLPDPAERSVAECAFGTVARGLVAEGRPDEYGLPTFPSRRFVSAGGLTLVHDGLPEYELVDIEETADGARARALALTLLRSTGMLSRLGMAYRPFPAGPLTPVEGLQLLGRRMTARYAVVLGPVDPWAVADDVLVPIEVAPTLGGGTRADRGSALTVDGAQVSAVRRVPGGLEMRVFNPTADPVDVTVADRQGWLVDLRGRPLEAFSGAFRIGPFALATARLDEPGPG